MKKYTIKDNLGNKETVYANDLSHAIKIKDTKKNLKDSIHDSYVEVPLVLNRFQIEAIQENWFDIKDTGKKENGFPVYRLTGDKEKIFRWLRTRYDKKFPLSAIHDSVYDEASLATTINALVNDEKAAIDAYNVAIKNLEGSVDDTARQVLINIRDDERRHIENLYAILNGQVTEKNLEDSIHDGVNEAKNLVASAGFNVLRAYGTDKEPYVTVKWDGSYYELRKKVLALKPEAKKIGYKDVYADGNDICFSIY